MSKKIQLKKGCIKNGLIIFVILVAVVIIALVIIANTLNNNSSDTRLKELLNREYSIPFTDKITTTQEQSTKSLLATNLILSDGSSLVTDGELDVEKLCSDSVRIVNSFNMTGYDFAVFANVILSLTSSNENDKYSNLVRLIDFNLQSVESGNTVLVNYRGTIRINLDKLKSSLDLPSDVYITIDATVDSKLSLDKMLVNSTIQVNRLTGEDNTFAVNAIRELFKFSDDDIKTIAKFPIDFFVERSAIWGASFKVEGSNFVFTKN